MPVVVARQLVAVLALVFALLVPGLASAQAPQKYVSIDVIADKRTVVPGQSVWVALRQKIAPGWHTYWKNPGDSGEPTKITWKLPNGFSASDIRWPIPEAIPVGGLLNHGYSDDVLLLSEIQVPTTAAGSVTLTADATWLVCKEICIPEEGSASVDLAVGAVADASQHTMALAQAVSRLPKSSPWTATFATTADKLFLTVEKAGLDPTRIASVRFFPNAWGHIAYAAPQPVAWNNGTPTLELTRGDLKDKAVGEIGGLLVIDEKLDGAGVRHGFEVQATAASPSSAGVLGLSARGEDGGTGLGLGQALIFAFLGGLILNLMPCVFPVLSLKALSLVTYGEAHRSERRKQGLAYFAGVMTSFAVGAAVLLGLRAAGETLGWGFQFQSPVFVLGMAALFFALGLSLSGVFLIGTSVTNMGAGLARRDGTSGSFFTGVLASLAATPCTAPFMGAALGFALTQPVFDAVAVMLALGAGFAVPLVALSYSDALARRLPKPGAWMETLKQVLAFPLYATVGWLVWVLSIQSGSSGVLAAVVVLLAVAFVAWLLGQPSRASLVAKFASIVLLVAAAFGSYRLLETPSSDAAATTTQADKISEPYTPVRLAELRAAGTPVFVNLTAAWCITCKVNEHVALSSDAFKRALKDKGIAYLKGDWTSKDPEITALLQSFGRAGVPLYLFYSGTKDAAPDVLPQILTSSAVLDRFANLPITPTKANGDQS